MLRIGQINNVNTYNVKAEKSFNKPSYADNSIKREYSRVSTDNLKAYIPSFTAINNTNNTQPSKQEQLKTVKSKLDKEYISVIDKLDKNGILDNNKSNDGSTVLDNLYGIATEPRLRGLSDKLILQEVLKSIDNPHTITQKFGDIPQNVAMEIEQETNQPLPKEALNIVSSTCTVTSIEFNMASKTPAEFARFIRGLSGKDYSVNKTIKLSDISPSISSALWQLKTFNTENKIHDNWDDVTLKISPDRNAIVRARIQTSYKDKGERSCIDALIQSALLNLGSQNTYDSITDIRTGDLNPDKTGLTDFEKTFVEEVVFGTPKISVVYQNLDENGVLVGYNCKPEETKQHILKSLELGENVIIGYTHFDENKKVDGGHEITIIGYRQDENGEGEFICNDTDDDIDSAITIKESKLLPLIHHAGISKDALSKNDTVVEPWREIVENFQSSIK